MLTRVALIKRYCRLSVQGVKWVKLIAVNSLITQFPSPAHAQRVPRWQVLLQYGGQEAAEAFEEVGHSDFARPLAPKVGVCAGFME